MHTYKSPHADDELMLITIIMLSVISEENDNVISYDDLLVARCSNFPVPLSYTMDLDAHPMTVHLTTRVEMDNLLKNNTCKSCYNSHISDMRILQGHLNRISWHIATPYFLYISNSTRVSLQPYLKLSLKIQEFSVPNDMLVYYFFYIAAPIQCIS